MRLDPSTTSFSSQRYMQIVSFSRESSTKYFSTDTKKQTLSSNSKNDNPGGGIVV